MILLIFEELALRLEKTEMILFVLLLLQLELHCGALASLIFPITSGGYWVWLVVLLLRCQKTLEAIGVSGSTAHNPLFPLPPRCAFTVTAAAAARWEKKKLLQTPPRNLAHVRIQE